MLKLLLDMGDSTSVVCAGSTALSAFSVGGGGWSSFFLRHFHRQDMSKNVATKHRIKNAHRKTDKKIMLGFISYSPSVTTIKHTNIIRNTLVKSTHQLIFSSSMIESTDPIDRRLRGTMLSNDTSGGSPCPLPKVSWCCSVLILWRQPVLCDLLNG